MTDIQRIGVVGAGTMGNGIAQVFTQAGFGVVLVDAAAPALERARTAIGKSLEKFVGKGTLTAAERDAALGRLSTGTDVDTLADADYIVEAIVEDAAAKRDLFARLDRLTRPDVILVLQHVFNLHHRAGGRDVEARQRARHALHEPGAADDARGADSRAGDVGRIDADRDGLVRPAREDGDRSRRLSRIHRQSRS